MESVGGIVEFDAMFLDLSYFMKDACCVELRVAYEGVFVSTTLPIS